MLLRVARSPGRATDGGGSGLGGRATAGLPSRAMSGHVGRTGDARTQLLELAVDVLIPPLNVMRAVDQRGALGGQRGEDQRRAGAQVGDVRLGAAQGRGTEDRRVVRVLRSPPGRRACPAPRATRAGPRRSPRGRVTCRWPASAARTRAAGGRSRGPGRAPSRCRTAAGRRGADRSRRSRSSAARRPPGRPTRPSSSTSASTCSQGAFSSVILPPVTAAATRNVPVSMRSETTVWLAPRSRRLPWTSIVSGLVRFTSAPILCRKSMRSSTSGSCAAGRITVWPSARVAASIAFSVPITVTCGKVTSPAVEATGRLGEVVAVAVGDLGAQRPHRVDVQVHRPAPDPVAARVADDHPPEARQERPEQDERGAHLGGGLERDEQPVDVARGDLVHAVGRVVHDHAEVLEHLRHDADVLDLGHVLEPAPFARQGRRGEQLEGRVLGPADVHRAAQGLAAFDAERLRRWDLGGELPMERFCVGHRLGAAPGALAMPALRHPDPQQGRLAAGRARRRGRRPRRSRTRARAPPRAAPPGRCSRSISDARSAVSAMTTTLSGRTWRKPPAIAKLSSSPPLRIFSSPTPSRLTSGVWCGRIPSSPSAPGTSTISTSSSYASRSGVTISRCSVIVRAPLTAAALGARLSGRFQSPRRLRAPRRLRSPAIRAPTRPLGTLPNPSLPRSTRPERGVLVGECRTEPASA